MFKVFSADGQFGKHFAIWEPFISYVLMCSHTQRYAMPPPPFLSHFLPLFLFSFASFLVPWWFHFLSSVSCLSPETNRSSSPLMKSVFGIENNPRNTGECYEKRQWMQTSGTFVARFCTFFFPGGWCVSTRLTSLQLSCLHGLTSPSAGTRHIGGANLISTKANSVLMLQLGFPHPVLQQCTRKGWWGKKV